MNRDRVIRVPRVIKTGPYSAVSIWPPDETGIVTTTFHSLARPEQPTPTGLTEMRGAASNG